MSDESDALHAELRRLHSEVDAREHDIRDMGEYEDRLEKLIASFRVQAQLRDEELGALRERLGAVEHELEDLRAIRDALTPPELPVRPGLTLAAAFVPVAEQVSGLTEARRDDGEFFGLAGVSAVLGELEDPSPSEAVAVLRARVAEYAAGRLTDDLCMLAARID